MKLNLKNIESIFDYEKFKLDQKYVTFLFFLLLSTIFWLLNTLGKKTDTFVPYSVKYLNLPENKVLVSDLPSRVLIKLEAPGYTLLKYKIQPPVNPLIINFKSSSLREEKGHPNLQKLYILTDYEKDNIQKQLNSEIRIIDIFPDSLIFNFSDIVTRRVPIIPNVELSLEETFMLRGFVHTVPDSIVISGPQFIVDTINAVETKLQTFKEVNSVMQRNVSLIGIRNVKFSQKRVVVEIPVEQFTEFNLKVPIVSKNLPDTLQMKVFPRYTKVSGLVASSDYEKLIPELFEAFVDYNSIEPGFSNKVKVNLDKFPDYIKSPKYYPRNVDYIIEK